MIFLLLRGVWWCLVLCFSVSLCVLYSCCLVLHCIKPCFFICPFHCICHVRSQSRKSHHFSPFQCIFLPLSPKTNSNVLISNPKSIELVVTSVECNQVKANRCCSCTLVMYGDIASVSTKSCSVLLDRL